MTEPKPSALAGVRGTATTVALSSLLAGRVLAMVGRNDAEAVASRVSLVTGGLVLTGQPDLGVLDRLRRRYPDLLLVQDPHSDFDADATVDAPFGLAEPDLFGGGDLHRALDDQIAAGASFALTPTRFIRAGDSATLKAVQLATAGMSRTDMVVRVPVDAGWAKPVPMEQLIAVLKRIPHPVALSFGSSRDPMEGRGVVEAVRRLSLEVPNVALWYTDLSAFAHISVGGLAGAVGFVPSLRHGAIPGKGGRARDKYDRTPHILVPEWLRYMQGSQLEERFATTQPPHCWCVVCDGRALDRFSGSDESRLEAHTHNVAVLMTLAAQLRKLDAGERLLWWRARLQAALAAHLDAEAQTGRSMPVPPALKAWMALQGIAS